MNFFLILYLIFVKLQVSLAEDTTTVPEDDITVASTTENISGVSSTSTPENIVTTIAINTEFGPWPIWLYLIIASLVITIVLSFIVYMSHFLKRKEVIKR